VELTVELVRIFALSVFTYTFFSVKILTLLQQCGYKIDEFTECIYFVKKKEIVKLLTYSLTFIVLLVLVSVFLGDYSESLSLSCLIIAVTISGVYYLKLQLVKSPKLTFRFLRIYVASCIVCGAIVLLIAYVVVCLNY
jgi:hypothetical protein